MRNQKLLRAGVLSVLSVLAVAATMTPPAEAGRGASLSSISSAIRSGNADAIISELERAERLVCGSCVEPVMALLDSDDYRIREVASWWFARRPAQKAEIRDLSIARLYGTDATLARNGADALGTFRHPDALPALAYAASRTDLSAEARAAAVRALGTISHRDGAPAIVAAMGDTDATVRAEAVKAYYALRGVTDGAPLLALLADADVDVRRLATGVVGTLASLQTVAGARAALEAALASDPDTQVRRNAAWALGQIGDAAARPALQAAVAGDASALVRSVARAAIAGLL